MSVDPGINATGYAVYRDGPAGHTLDIIEYDTLSPPKNARDYSKAAWIADAIFAAYQFHECNFLIMEIPGQSVYNQKKLTKGGAIARMQSLFKTFFVVGAIAHSIRRMAKSPVYLVLPAHWQYRKGRRKAKEWSVETANGIANHCAKTYQHIKPSQDHVADAICIGYYMREKILDGNFPEEIFS